MSTSRKRGVAEWITANQLLLLVLLAPWLLLPEIFPKLAVPALVCVPLLWLVRRIAGGSFSKRTPLDWPIVGLVAALAFGACIAPIPSLAAPKLCAIVLGVAGYYAIVDLSTTPARLRAAGGGVALIVVVVSLAGLVGADWNNAKMIRIDWLYDALPRLVEGVPRSEGGGFHPNQVGAALACLIPVLVALLVRPTESSTGSGRGARAWCLRVLRGRPLVYAGLAVSTFVLLLTQSRTSWGAAVLGLILLAVILARRRWVTRCAVAAALAIALSALATLAVAVRAETLREPDGIPGLHSVSSRLEIWTAGWRVAQDYFFTGAGLANFDPVSRLHYPLAGVPISYPMTHSHNLVLQALSDGGVIGLACLLWLLAGTASLAVHALARVAPGQRAMIAGAASGLAAWLVLNLPDCLPLGSKPGTALWLLLGLVIGGVCAVAPGQAAARTPKGRRGTVWVAAGVLTLALAFLLPATRARLLANLGRMHENRALLSPSEDIDSIAHELTRSADLLSGSLDLRADEPRAAEDLAFVHAALAAPADALRRLGLRCGAQGVEWIAVHMPSVMVVDEDLDIDVTLRNCGQLTWLAQGEERAVLSYRWLDSDGSPVKNISSTATPRTAFAFDVAPNTEVSVRARVFPPPSPGEFQLRWDVYVMGTGWLHALGCEPYYTPVTVAKR